MMQRYGVVNEYVNRIEFTRPIRTQVGKALLRMFDGFAKASYSDGPPPMAQCVEHSVYM